MKKKKKLAYFILLLLCASMLCGFGSKAELTLDTEARRLYECYSIDTIISGYLADKDLAKNQYDKKYVRVLGIVGEKAKSNKSFELNGINVTSDKIIKCTTSNKDIISSIEEIEVDSKVNVYGKLTVGITGTLEISIDKIISSDANGVMDSTFALKDTDYEINRSKLYKRTLDGEKIAFYIPAGWKDVEQNITEKKLGTMEGYQYNLNNISSSNTNQVVTPECFFVTYFDNSMFLKNTNERGKTNEIEKAIIKNILGEVGKFSAKTVNTYYGQSYQYYQDVFKDDDSQSYRTEFVFQPVDKDGIIVYIYLYKDNKNMKHIDEVMSVLRFAEAE